MQLQASRFRTCSRRFSLLLLIATLVTCLTASGPIVAQPILEFTAPTNNALIPIFDEIPIVLRAVASNDVFLTGEVFANNVKIADVSYCCSFCRCARPQPGEETILRIPVPSNNGNPPSRPWIFHFFGVRRQSGATTALFSPWAVSTDASGRLCHKNERV